MRSQIFLLIAIVFTFLSLTLCVENFNLDRPKMLFLEDENKLQAEDVSDRYHGAGVLFVAGFIRGVELFQNVTQSKECLSILPVIHDDWAEVSNKLRNVTNYKEMLEAVKFLLNKLEHLDGVFRDSRPYCKTMFEDVYKVLRRLRGYLTKDKTKLILTHFLNNLGSIFGKIELMKEELRSEHWYRAGVDLGDLIRFSLFWDFKSNIDYTYFNRPPFRFE